jgi:DNA-binding beta-propeller fold protein YncE
MYIGDLNNRQIRKISTDQAVSSFFGDFTPTDGAGTTVFFKHPSGMSTDSQGNLLVADGGNNMIRKISPSGYVTLVAGKVQQGNSDGVGASAGFFNPVGLSINTRNEIFVADSGNYAIRKISVSGAVTSVIRNIPHGITAPTGIFVDKNDQLFFTDCGYGWIYRRSNTGNITQLASGANLGGSSGLFWNQPYQIWVDSKGYIYLADAGNHRICKSINDGGYFTVLAGQQSAGNFVIYGHKDGLGTAATFYNPKAIVMDKEGSLYIADASNNVIRKISNSGMVTTLAGSGIKGHANGSALSASFNHPAGLALSPDETVLYVADQGNDLIRKIILGK